MLMRRLHYCSLLLAILFVVRNFPVHAAEARVLTNCTWDAFSPAAAQGGTVCFACDGVLEMPEELPLRHDLVLVATGRAVVVSGSGSNRLFTVPADVNVTFRGLILSGGSVT